MKNYVCRHEGCMRSYRTRKGRDRHEDRTHGEVNPDA